MKVNEYVVLEYVVNGSESWLTGRKLFFAGKTLKSAIEKAEFYLGLKANECGIMADGNKVYITKFRSRLV